MFLILKIWKFD